ncbi:hypothetical protein AGLY_014971 [Aphis glycines]|uniref:Uncharacterized protein n=1 Tax=Aphis glycines TaxID=307491 RepID=A0A6G0T4T2_APHGL|nr:hypothetical protein AGLY_014971 [Aphis glycines]
MSEEVVFDSNADGCVSCHRFEYDGIEFQVILVFEDKFFSVNRVLNTHGVLMESMINIKSFVSRVLAAMLQFEISCIKYAPITSVDVESLFSMYTIILPDNRVKFTTANQASTVVKHKCITSVLSLLVCVGLLNYLQIFMITNLPLHYYLNSFIYSLKSTIRTAINITLPPSPIESLEPSLYNI